MSPRMGATRLARLTRTRRAALGFARELRGLGTPFAQQHLKHLQVLTLSVIRHQRQRILARAAALES